MADKYAIYARKSTESEDRQVLSIAAQVLELKNLAQKRGFNVSEVFTESQSAKSPGRPIFSKLLKQISHGQIKGILCWKLDRLARNPIDGGAIIWAMKEQGLHIQTPTQSYNTAEDNVIMMYIEFGMAQKYIDDLSQNVKRGNRMKLDRGELPGLAPQGYLNDLATHTIVPDPDRFHFVRRMWDLMLTGTYSVPQITRTANDEWGYRTRKTKRTGGNPISSSNVYRIFSNPFYYGVIERTGDDDETHIHAGAHKPMISEEEYMKVQHVLGRNTRSRPKRKHSFPYIGLMHCGECGGAITAEAHTKKSGRHYIYYRCTKKRGPCGQPFISQTKLEEQIGQELVNIQVSDTFRDWALKHIKNAHDKETATRTKMYKNQQTACTTVQHQLDRLVDMQLRDLLSEEEYREKRQKLQKELSSLKLKITDTEDRAKRWLELTEQAFIFAHKAKKQFEMGTHEQRREIIVGLGSNFVLKDKKVLIDLHEPFRLVKNANLKNKQSRLSPRLFALGRGNATTFERLVDKLYQYFSDETILHYHIPKLSQVG